jgi:hypothetical protein
MKKIKWIGFALLLTAAGCTTSRITTSWKAESTTPQLYNKVMVLSLIREADRSIQENMENHFVDDLKELGYNAVSSLKQYGPKAFDKMTEEEAIGELKNSGVDAVITIVLLDKEICIICPTDIITTGFGVTAPHCTAAFMSRVIMLPTPNIFGKVIFMI